MTAQEQAAAESNAKLAELVKQLREQNEQLAKDIKLAKAGHQGKLTLKVSEKGGVSVYGMGRFPVTLYREQWARLFEAKANIEAFIEAHAAELKSKGDAVADDKTGTDGK